MRIKILENKSDFFNPFFTKLAGQKLLQEQIEAGWTADEIRESWKPGLERYKRLERLIYCIRCRFSIPLKRLFSIAVSNCCFRPHSERCPPHTQSVLVPYRYRFRKDDPKSKKYCRNSHRYRAIGNGGEFYAYQVTLKQNSKNNLIF